MDITCYLPDALGARAKARELKFSALLREAVTAQLEELEQTEATLAKSGVHEVTLVDENGYVYDARLHGAELCVNDEGHGAYLLDDGDLAVYDNSTDGELFHYSAAARDGLPESDWLSGWFSPGEIVDIMRQLGKRAVIDIGEA